MLLLFVCTHTKLSAQAVSNCSCLANPGNVKLRESSGKAGGLPIGFKPFNVVIVLTIAEITIQVKHPNLLLAPYCIIRVNIGV